MCNDRKKLIDKIKKLLALAGNNNNEAECVAAALKAQKLIADNNIEDFELNEKTPENIEELLSDPYCGKRWREILAAIVAENFRCKSYILYSSKNSWKNGKMFQQVFVGYTSDASAALLVYNKLVEVGEVNAKLASQKAKKLYGTSQGVKNTFLLGFCYGVKLELEKQAQALMIVIPKAVNDYIEMNIAPSFDPKSAIGGFELGEPTLDYTNEGKSAGRDAIRSSRLEEGQATYILK